MTKKNSGAGFLTIEGFESLTKQQLFDISLTHIRTTRERSMKDDINCTYQGTGCAAAPFIRPDQRAAADVGRDDRASSAWEVLVEELLVPEHEREFVQRLQSCHDNASTRHFMPSYEGHMEKLAKEYSLTYTPEKL